MMKRPLLALMLFCAYSIGPALALATAAPNWVADMNGQVHQTGTTLEIAMYSAQAADAVASGESHLADVHREWISLRTSDSCPAKRGHRFALAQGGIN